MLLLPLSTGVSKSLPVIVRTPPDVIEKNDSSVPLFDHVTDSFAVKVCTAAEFSDIDFEEVAPVAEPGPVIVGEAESF